MFGRTLMLVTAAAFSLSACAQGFGPGPSPPNGYQNEADPTVRVHNDGLAAVAVYEQGRSVRLGTVMPGQTECLEMDNASQERKRLIARPVGGGEATVSPAFDTDRGQGWSWSLANTPRLDRISLERAEPCG